MPDESAFEKWLLAFCDKHLRGEYTVQNEKIRARYCPFCGGGDNADAYTFDIYPSESGVWVYSCRRGKCGRKGTLKGLAKELEGGTVAAQTNEYILRSPKKHYDRPDSALLRPLTDECVAYFAKRKISQSTLTECGVMSDADGNIAFPFYYNGDLTLVKYRRPFKPEDARRKEWASPNCARVFWNIDRVSLHAPVYITEGMIDALSLYEAGVTNVISVPSGADSYGAAIEGCWDLLQKIDDFVIFGDSDDPGRKMESGLITRLGEAKCSIVASYPARPDSTPCKDANEILYFHGAEKLAEVAGGHSPVPMDGIIDASTVHPKKATSTKRIPSSLPTINQRLGGYRPGQLVIWSGKRGEGKSTAVGQEVLTAMNAGESVAMFSGELDDEEVIEWLDFQCAGSEYLGLEWDEFRQMNVPFLSYEAETAISEWYRGRLFLVEPNREDFEYSTADLCKLFVYAIRRFNTTVLVVDNLMVAMMGADDKEYYRAQERFTAMLKKIARRYKVVIHLVCHPRKTSDTPGNDDVSGSSAITNLADIVMFVRRGVVRVTKDRKYGQVGTEIPFTYYPDSRRMMDAAFDYRIDFSWNKEGVPKPEELAESSYPPVYYTALPV